MREVVIASSVRTPVGRAFKGTLRATRPDELAAVAIKRRARTCAGDQPQEKSKTSSSAVPCPKLSKG